MDPEEKKLRMQRMRKVVSEHNIYRWAASLIAELCEVRTEVVGRSPKQVETDRSAA
jgi:trehalose 6-phosphate synthase